MVEKRTQTIQPALNESADPTRNDPAMPGEVRDMTARNAAQNSSAPGETRLDATGNPQLNQAGQPNQQDNRRRVSIDRSRVNSEIDAWLSAAQDTDLKDGQEHVLKITAGMDGDFHVDRSILQKPV
jgi:hypothetical protein